MSGVHSSPSPSPHHDRSAGPPLTRLAIWAALTAAAAELAMVAAQRPVLGRFAFVGPDVWWTVPLVNVAVFLVAALGFAVAGRLWPRLAWWRVALWCYVTAAVVLVLYLVPEVHRLAAVLLGAGVASQAVRLAAARATAFHLFVRRATPWLAALALAAAVFARGGAIWHERSMLAASPPARGGAPNVLLIVLDTVRAKNLGWHGHSRPTTPNLDRWVRQGVAFTEAFSNASWTLPSHASMLTGRWAHEMSANWTEPLDDTWPTLPQALASRGYATAGIVANTDYASREVGLGRGFGFFDDYSLTPGLIARSAALGRVLGRTPLVDQTIGRDRAFGRKNAPQISSTFLDWIDGLGQRPWFAMLNYYDAHRPYLPPAPFFRAFASPGVPPDPRYRQDDDPANPWTPDDAARFLVAYDGAIAYLDAEIHRLLEQLRTRGLLDRTLVIITSDHGEEFGEHRLFDHGHSLYLASVHVPFVMLAPGWAPAATVVARPVSLRDIPATVLDFVEPGGQAAFPGQSVARFWADGAAVSDEFVASGVRQVDGQPAWYPASRGDVIALTHGSLRYIRNLGDGSEELFDFRRDPDERHDLARGPSAETLLRPFREHLKTMGR